MNEQVSEIEELCQAKRIESFFDEVRDVMRFLHYSIHIERSYCDWIKKFVFFHGMKSREDLRNGEKKIEVFLTHLAVNNHVLPSTQNQAMNALVFLCKHVLKQPLDEKINAVRADPKKNIPVVMTREEVAKVFPHGENCPPFSKGRINH
jgi:hypothetical protein